MPPCELRTLQTLASRTDAAGVRATIDRSLTPMRQESRGETTGVSSVSTGVSDRHDGSLFHFDGSPRLDLIRNSSPASHWASRAIQRMSPPRTMSMIPNPRSAVNRCAQKIRAKMRVVSIPAELYLQREEPKQDTPLIKPRARTI